MWNGIFIRGLKELLNTCYSFGGRKFEHALKHGSKNGLFIVTLGWFVDSVRKNGKTELHFCFILMSCCSFFWQLKTLGVPLIYTWLVYECDCLVILQLGSVNHFTGSKPLEKINVWMNGIGSLGLLVLKTLAFLLKLVVHCTLTWLTNHMYSFLE